MSDEESTSPSRNQWIAAGVVTLVVVVFLAIALMGGGDGDEVADSPTSASSSSTSRATATTDKPTTTTLDDGFGSIEFAVRASSGSVFEGCALLAAGQEQLGKGMMGREGFGEFDAMIFRFEDDVTSHFYMKNVQMPLSVAWFRVDGTYVSARDMDLCPPDAENCPTYPAEGPYRFALETPGGGLDELGIGPGSILQLGGSCTPTPAA